ncbi:hypothetical protein EDC04DRAFT_3142853 [Pisolithus marmoratus]|nr:hypothetical protein EDC04DRAFT_3142853 [Pisolithus marmoratus]
MAGNNRSAYLYGLESQTQWATPTDAYHIGSQAGHAPLIPGPGPTALPPRYSPAPPPAHDSRQNTLVYTIERRATSRERSHLLVPSGFSAAQTRSTLSPSTGTFAQHLYASAIPKPKPPSPNTTCFDGSAAPIRSANHHAVNQGDPNLGQSSSELQLEALSRDFGSKAFLISRSAGDEEWNGCSRNSDEKRAVPSYTATFAQSPTSASPHDHAVPNSANEAGPQYLAPASSSTTTAIGPSEAPLGSNTPADHSNVIRSSPVPDVASGLDPLALPPDPEDIAEDVPPYTLVDETPPPPDLNGTFSDTSTRAGESHVPLNPPPVEDPLPAAPSYTANPPSHSQRTRSPPSSATSRQVYEAPSGGRNEGPCRLSTMSSRSSSTLNSEFAADLYGQSYARHSSRERARSTSSHANSVLALPPPPPMPSTNATNEMMAMHAGHGGISSISTQVTPLQFPSNNTSTSHLSMQSPVDGFPRNHHRLSDTSAMQAYAINTTGMLRRPTGDSTPQSLLPHSSFTSPSSSPVSSHPVHQHPLYPAPQQPPRKLRRPPPVPNRLRRPSTAPYSPAGSDRGFQMQQGPRFPPPGPW